MKPTFGTYRALFLVFFKAGTFTFAGGLAMLPVIERDVVETYQLMNREDFLEYATLAQTLPGVIAVNCAAFVGRNAAGTAGMLVAAFGACVSAFVIMLLATILLQHIPMEGAVMGAMRCIRAASSALILSAAFSLGRYNLRSAFSILVMLAVMMSVLLLNLSAPLAVLLAGGAGCLWQWMQTRKGGVQDDAG